MTQEIIKALHEALGKCWHEQFDHEILECSKCKASMLFPWERNPNYCSDPRLVIEAMREMEDWQNFFEWNLGRYESDNNPWHLPERYFIDLDLIMDKTGKLALLALEWLEGKK